MDLQKIVFLKEEGVWGRRSRFACSRCEMRALRAQFSSLLSKWLIGWPRGSNLTQAWKKKIHTCPPELGVLFASTPAPLTLPPSQKSYEDPRLVQHILPLPHLPSHVSPACFKPFKSYHTHKYLKFPCLLPPPGSVLSLASARRKLKTRKQIPSGLSLAPTLLVPSTHDSFSSIKHLHAVHTAICRSILLAPNLGLSSLRWSKTSLWALFFLLSIVSFNHCSLFKWLCEARSP